MTASKRKWPQMILLTACVLFAVLELGGCVAFYTYDTQRLMVVDAETGLPLEGAEVNVGYANMYTLNPPKSNTKLTNREGKADLRVASYSAKALNARKDNYLQKYNFAVPAKEKEIELRLYKQPEAMMRVMVADGYRGPLLIDKFATGKWIQDEPGKREFDFRAGPRGYVRVDASELLMRWEADVMVVTDSGKEFRLAGLREDEVGLRYVTMHETQKLFVIGTRADEQAVMRRAFLPGPGGSRTFDPQKFAKFVEETR